jgi:lysozyme
MIQGIDVSSWQGVIDWKSLRKQRRDIQFAMIRCAEWRSDTMDAGQLDTQFEANVEGARRNGITVGVYNRAFPTLNSPEQEATEFVTRLSHFDAYGLGWIKPAIDIEDSSQNWSSWVRDFFQAWEDMGMRDVLFYSSGSYYDKYYGGVNDLPECVSTWIGHMEQWGATPGNPTFKTRGQIHQYSHTGSVAGINGNVDLNVLMPNIRLRDVMM